MHRSAHASRPEARNPPTAGAERSLPPAVEVVPAVDAGPPHAGSVRGAAVGTLAADGALLALGIVTGILVARWLQPEGRGALAVVMLWPQLFASVGLWSVGEAITYRIGLQPRRAATVVASGLWLSLGLALLVLSAGYLALPALLGGTHQQLVPLARTYLLVFIPLNFIGLVLLASDHGALRFQRFNSFRVLLPPVYLAGLLVLWAGGWVRVSTVVAASIVAAVVHVGLQAYVHRAVFRLRPSWSETRKIFRTASRFHPATLLLLLGAHIDQLVVLTRWDAHSVGQYAVALAVASAGTGTMAGALYRVFFPHLSRLESSDDRALLLARSIRLLSLLLVLIAVPLGLLMPYVVALVVGPEYMQAVPVARILLAAHVLVALQNFVVQSLRGSGDGVLGWQATGLSVTAYLLFVFPAGRALGLNGVALALGLSTALAVGYLFFQLCRRSTLRLGDLWGLNLATVGEVRRLVRSTLPTR